MLLLFVLLGGGTAWYLNNKPSGKMATLTEERLFHVEDTGQIQKIFLADRKGNTTTLVRQGAKWLYNGKHLARQNVVHNLLQAIHRIRIRYIPSDAAVPNVVSTMAAEGIKVEIYGRGDKKINTYYVGGMTNDEMGTYMMREGYENPFVMHIPNWQGGLRARYEVKGDDWRDRGVLRESIDNIESVSVEYPKQKNQSFVLSATDGDYSVKPFYEVTPAINRPLKKGRMEAFLYSLENVQAEGYKNKSTKKDSVSALVPFMKMTIKRKDGESKTINFHPIIPYDSEGNLLTDDRVATQTAVERYHVSTSEGDFLVGQHRNFEKAFWGYPQFFD